jgi:hypothetical protein
MFQNVSFKICLFVRLTEEEVAEKVLPFLEHQDFLCEEQVNVEMASHNYVLESEVNDVADVVEDLVLSYENFRASSKQGQLIPWVAETFKKLEEAKKSIESGKFVWVLLEIENCNITICNLLNSLRLLCTVYISVRTSEVFKKAKNQSLEGILVLPKFLFDNLERITNESYGILHKLANFKTLEKSAMLPYVQQLNTLLKTGAKSALVESKLVVLNSRIGVTIY